MAPRAARVSGSLAPFFFVSTHSCFLRTSFELRGSRAGREWEPRDARACGLHVRPAHDPLP